MTAEINGRADLEKMKASLLKEREEFTAQLNHLRTNAAQTEIVLQRTEGALVVVEKLLNPQPEAPPAKPDKKDRKAK